MVLGEEVPVDELPVLGGEEIEAVSPDELVPGVAPQVAQRLVDVHDPAAVVHEDGLERRLGEAAEALLALPELLLRLLAVGDVEQQAQQAVGADRRGVDEAVPHRAVLPPDPDLVAAATEGQEADQALGQVRRVVPGEQVGDREGHELLPGEAGERAGRAVDLEVPPPGVRDEQSDGRSGEVGAVELAALAQGLRGPEPLHGARHVAREDREEALVGLAERRLPGALRVEDAEHARAHLQGRADLRPHVGVEGEVARIGPDVVEATRLAGRRDPAHDTGAHGDREELVRAAPRAEGARVVEEPPLRVHHQEARSSRGRASRRGARSPARGAPPRPPPGPPPRRPPRSPAAPRGCDAGPPRRA